MVPRNTLFPTKLQPHSEGLQTDYSPPSPSPSSTGRPGGLIVSDYPQMPLLLIPGVRTPPWWNCEIIVKNKQTDI